jgi:hypothetical protein
MIIPLSKTPRLALKCQWNGIFFAECHAHIAFPPPHKKQKTAIPPVTNRPKPGSSPYSPTLFPFYPLSNQLMKLSLQIPASLVFPFITLTTMLFSNPASGLTPVSDNFDDNLLDFSKWQVVAGIGLFSETGSKLDYSVIIPSIFDGDYAELACTTSPSSSEDWQAIIDVTNTTTPNAVGEISSVGIQVSNAADPNDLIFLELYSSALDELPPRRGFVSSLITNGNDVPASDIDTGDLPGQTAGSLRLAYNGTTKVLTTYYDASGSSNGFQWVQLSSYGLNGLGGANGNSNWGTMASGLYVSIYGFSEAMIINSGQVTLDNFSLQSNTPPPTPIQSWQIAKFGSTSDPDAALNLDPDKDGLKNIIEYAFKLEPEVPGTPVLTTLIGTSGLPRITPIGSGPTQRLRLEYVRMKASSNPGITYTPQFSSNLQGGGWSAITGPETTQSIDTEWERVVVEDTAGTGLPNRFGRVVVTAP